MTRAEFFENVTSWWELKDFCDEQRCSLCDDVYDDEARDDYINEYLSEWARNENWYDLRVRLDNLETGYEYWRLDDYGDWTGLDDDDLDNMKDEVAEWVDDYGDWDDDEEEVDEEEDEEPFDDEEEEPPIEDEDCSLGELFAASATRVKSIAEDELEKAREEDRAFAVLMSAV